MSLQATLRTAARRCGGFVAPVLLLAAGMTQPTIELSAPPKVSPGDTVEIVLRIRNDGPKLLELELSGRPVGYDVIVTDAAGREVWRRLEGTAVGAALMLLTLKPGESRDFTTRWPQVDGQGRAVAPGRYTLRGVLPMGARQISTASRELIIEP
jgi:Intracellular proteinase inhibitor